MMPPRILVVEDEAVTSMVIEDILTGLGCTVVGPAGRLPDALALAEEPELDGAVLDLNLDGHPAYPVADRLVARAVPFLFLTGYGAKVLPAAYAHLPVLQKPFRVADLARMVAEACHLPPTA